MKTLIIGTLDLLNPDSISTFLAGLTNFDYPRKWSHFQNPFSHIKSYFFSDFARLMMVGPFLIDKLDAMHFLSGILDTMKDRMNLSRCTLVVKEILACWVAMASMNALCFSSHIDNYMDIDKRLYELGLIVMKVKSWCSEQV